MKVLDIFREGDFEKMIIHKNDTHIVVERTKDKNIKGKRVKDLRRLLGMNQYEQIEVKFRNDKHLIVKNIKKNKN